TANVAAASLGIAGSGGISGALSVGVSLADNYVGNRVEAFIQNGQNVTARSGNITITANVPLDEANFPSEFTTDSGSRTLSTGAAVRVASDFTGSGDKGSVYHFLGEQYRFTTNSGVVTVDPTGNVANGLHKGDIIKLADDYTGGGQAGAFYTYNPQSGTTAPTTIDVGATDYTDTSLWQPVTQNLATENYNDTSRWLKDSTITALSVAASLSAAFGSNGIAVSGAGAESTTVIVTQTNAYVEGSHLTAHGTGNVLLDAENSSSVNATVVAASAALAFAGNAAVGASIGVAIGRNLIGQTVNA